MGKTIYLTIESITIVVFIFELYFSIIASRKNRDSSIIRFFYLYPIAGIVIGIVILLFRFNIIPLSVVSNFNNFSLLFHFLFWSFIFYFQLKKALILKLSISFLFFILLLLIISELKVFYGYSIAFANGCLFIFSIIYFFKLLNNPPIKGIIKDPIFISFCGIFIGTGLIIPFHSMFKFILLMGLPNDTYFAYGIFSALGYLILNLFFLKAMILISKSQ